MSVVLCTKKVLKSKTTFIIFVILPLVGCPRHKKNSFKIKDDFYNLVILPLVGGVLLPGLPEPKLGVGGLERASGVQRDQIAGLSNRLGGVDGASDLRKNRQIDIAKTTFDSFFLLPIG